MQEETGRKVLNVSPWFSSGIKGLPQEESEPLLDEIMEYLLDWHMGQMVLWDNWRKLHCAEGVNLDDTRLLMRTTIEGDYGFEQVEGGAITSRADHISV